MMTVGGSVPCRVGVFAPLAAEGEPVTPPNLSGPPVLFVPPTFPRRDGWLAAPCSPLGCDVLLGGSGLLRMSLRFEAEEEGVRTGDWVAESRELAEDGDAVPSLWSLFFLEALLGSLPRDNCEEIKQVSKRSGKAVFGLFQWLFCKSNKAWD